MKKLLVPVDGSKTGETALPWAKLMSEKQNCAIELLSCFRPLSAAYSYPDFATPPPVAYDLSGFIRTSEKYLRMLVKEYELPHTTTLVQEGSPAVSILERSESEDVDAILLSSHGRGGLGRWLLGSTSTKVVRGSKKPVYIFNATEDEPDPPSPRFNKILVCLDGSKIAEEAVNAAIAIAESHGSELTLYRAAEYFPYPASAYEVAIDVELEDCEKYLSQVAERYPTAKINTSAELTSAGRGILKRAPDYDLVVMTSHGLSGFERWLLGSVTEKVMHRIKKPLLVVHSSIEEDH